MSLDRSDPSARRACEVLHLVSTFEIKTDTKWLLQIARHLDRDRFRLSAACFYGGGPVRDRLEAMGVRTHNLETRGERDPRAVLRARRLIDAGAYDVVHTHLLRADLLGGAAARWAGVPVVVSTIYALGQYSRTHRRRSDPILDAACARLPTHFLAVSEAVRRDCVARRGIPSERVTVIRTGIDPPESVDVRAAARLRREWGVSGADILIVAAARLSLEKGIDVLIDAAAALRASHPSARFVVIGEGDDRSRFEARITEHGLGERFRLAGFHDDVWPALAAADVVCLPSRSEGLPNALLEAMSVERPVVVTDVGGMPEVIEHGRNGLIVPSDDPSELASALAILIDRPALRGQLGVAARKTVDERFLARDVVARYGELYSRLLPQRGRNNAIAESLA